jgi:hypothetical protein
VGKRSLCWCPRCGANVVDVDGYCMLGHRLVGDSPDPTEVAPEDPMRISPGTSSAQEPGAQKKPRGPSRALSRGERVTASPGAGSHDELAPVWTQLEDITEAQHDDPIFAFAPAPRIDWGPEGRAGYLKSDLGLLRRLKPQTR